MCLSYCHLHTSERGYGRGIRDGVSPGRPLGSCSVAPGVWAQQLGGSRGCLLGVGSSRTAVLKACYSQDEMGRPWMDRCSCLGEGCRLEMSLESSQGGRGKARRGQVGYSTYVQVMVVCWTQQSCKEWWSGAQLRPLVLCLSVTSHSCSEADPYHLHPVSSFFLFQITCTAVSELLATAIWKDLCKMKPSVYVQATCLLCIYSLISKVNTFCPISYSEISFPVHF